jgi:hypothetical protein
MTQNRRYDKFCAYVAEKNDGWRVQVFEPRGESSLSTALPDMVQSLGEKDSSLSKVMVIEMLGIITRDVGPSRNRIHAFETYTKAKPGAELDPMPGSS